MSTTERIALVTGAGRGLGAEIARALAADGWTVAVNDLTEDAAAAVADSIAAREARHHGQPRRAGLDPG